MDAQVPHLRKYTDKYRSIYPGAKQIIVKSDMPDLFQSYKKHGKLMEGPAELLAKEMSLTPPPRLLVHAFSNGGAYSLTGIGNYLNKVESLNNAPTSTTCLILDSTPGTTSLRLALAAVTTPIKGLFARLAAKFFFTVILVVLIVYHKVTGQEHLIDKVRKDLNNPRLLPWMSKETPRLYIYSDSDKMIPSSAVDEHIAEAKQMGLNARGEFFQGSEHVAHGRRYPERYWEAIQSLWREALRFSVKN
ncbi:hypothetical protein C8Q75DRAFT_299663 [Abortiporus biennis]|nr:hypothetical protein C8Q75DRAFT_299663 [Abortiporus biennis]